MAGKNGGKELRKEPLHKTDTRGHERQGGRGVDVGWWVVGRGEGRVKLGMRSQNQGVEGRWREEERRRGDGRVEARGPGPRVTGGTSAFAHWPWVPTPSPPNLIVRYLRVQEGTARRWQCVITLAPVAASAYGAAVGHLLFPTSRPQLALPFCWAPVQKQQTMRLSGCRREQAEDPTRLDFGFKL